MTFKGTTIPHAVYSPDWGQSRDRENESVINGARNWTDEGDHAELTVTVYLFKCTESEVTAVKAMKRQEGTLVTPLGTGTFRCTQIKYGLLDNLEDKQIAVMTFKSKAYV